LQYLAIYLTPQPQPVVFSVVDEIIPGRCLSWRSVFPAKRLVPNICGAALPSGGVVRAVMRSRVGRFGAPAALRSMPLRDVGHAELFFRTAIFH